MATADDLEDLFLDAMAVRPRTGVKNLPISALVRQLRKEYTDPANWLRTRTLRVISTQGDLGTFVEYLHVRDPGCRRLVAEPSAQPTAHEIWR